MMWTENKGAIAKKKKIDPFKFSDQVENTKLIPSKNMLMWGIFILLSL